MESQLHAEDESPLPPFQERSRASAPNKTAAPFSISILEE